MAHWQDGMIGVRRGNTRAVSGEGGSCFYRSVAYQLCEREQRSYVDHAEVSRLRSLVKQYLALNRDKPVPSDRELLWRHVGSYTGGYAEAPVPQAMAYAIGTPVTVHVNGKALHYGGELPGCSIHVRLQGLHYDILYDPVLRY